MCKPRDYDILFIRHHLIAQEGDIEFLVEN